MSAREIILKSITELSGVEYPPETPLDDTGLDSLSFVQLLVDLEGIFDIEFAPERLDIRKYAAIEELIKVTEGLLNDKS